MMSPHSLLNVQSLVNQQHSLQQKPIPAVLFLQQSRLKLSDDAAAGLAPNTPTSRIALRASNQALRFRTMSDLHVVERARVGDLNSLPLPQIGSNAEASHCTSSESVKIPIARRCPISKGRKPSGKRTRCEVFPSTMSQLAPKPSE